RESATHTVVHIIEAHEDERQQEPNSIYRNRSARATRGAGRSEARRSEAGRSGSARNVQDRWSSCSDHNQPLQLAQLQELGRQSSRQLGSEEVSTRSGRVGRKGERVKRVARYAVSCSGLTLCGGPDASLARSHASNGSQSARSCSTRCFFISCNPTPCSAART